MRNEKGKGKRVVVRYLRFVLCNIFHRDEFGNRHPSVSSRKHYSRKHSLPDRKHSLPDRKLSLPDRKLSLPLIISNVFPQLLHFHSSAYPPSVPLPTEVCSPSCVIRSDLLTPYMRSFFRILSATRNRGLKKQTLSLCLCYLLFVLCSSMLNQ